MHTHSTQPHYTPASVGALMDPAFLRGAVSEAYGERHGAPTSSRLGQRVRLAWHAFAAVLRRH